MEKSNNQNNQDTLTSYVHPWDINENVIWLCSTIRLIRNIEKFPFPQKLETERKKHILSLILKALLKQEKLQNPKSLQSADLQPLEKEFLVEHFLFFEGFSDAGGGTAFVIDDSGEFISVLNVKDHIQLQSTDCSGDLEKTWAFLVGIEEGLSQSLNFAYSPKFGFLTSDPLHCGTGLICSSYLHIPCLIHLSNIKDLIACEQKEGILATGMDQNPDEFIGDILLIRNKYTIGLNEESIVALLRNSILRIVIQEKNLRSKVKQEKNSLIIDKISRALGILKYSFNIETQEALSAISFLKLGIELGWITGMTVRQVNYLLFEVRRAHLLFLLHKLEPTDAAVKRAEFIREQVHSLELDVQAVNVDSSKVLQGRSIKDENSLPK